MRIIVVCILLSIFFYSCAPKQPVWENGKCHRFVKNDFGSITERKTYQLINNDTIIATEVKFECVFNPFTTQKMMFDNFGKWNEFLTPNDRDHGKVLKWDNVQLFENDTKKFTVLADCVENHQTMYASILVIDENGNDMLDSSSVYKDKLIEFFSQRIRANKSNDDDFEELYWTTFDPETWQTILKQKRQISESNLRERKKEKAEREKKRNNYLNNGKIE
ncbi:MAG: hypothetical protein ACSHWW_07285 [Nonlabens sp.]|uniref:hypothetical protein n=1 Tax=Nonlabens sp. TaxID=1888209 RepID=UPI003EFA2311